MPTGKAGTNVLLAPSARLAGKQTFSDGISTIRAVTKERLLRRPLKILLPWHDGEAVAV